MEEQILRTGIGYDVHRLVEGRDLIVGGVKIDHEKGLLGHSDADVLLHAIMDAILGAAALGDIGKHFPDTDPEYEGASSIELLKEVGKMVSDKLYVIENIDAIIIAERPKFRPYIDQMRQNIADALGLDIDQVSVKATTEEGLGFTGKKEGISSQAIATLQSIYENQSMAADSAAGTAGCAGCPGAQLRNSKDSKVYKAVHKKEDQL
jgi:2-C-methyl-D-erythritol 2,4-cyclodiphosphate synthase